MGFTVPSGIPPLANSSKRLVVRQLDKLVDAKSSNFNLNLYERFIEEVKHFVLRDRTE